MKPSKLLKFAAKSTLTTAVSNLPATARWVILDQFTRDGTITYEKFLAIARRFNVKGLSVRGEFGVFQSTSDDISVLGAYALSRTWAPETNRLLREFFDRRGGGTYVDVGANIGLTTVPIAQNRHVNCIALEPEPINFQNLVRNVEANCAYGNVKNLQVAVYSTETSVELELATAGGNLGDHRVRLKNEPGRLDEQNRRTIKVRAAPLDDLVDHIDGSLAIKIDTQGAEPFVVEGGKRVLERAGLVIMEFWPYGMKRMGANGDHMIQYVERSFDALSMLHKSNQRMTAIPMEHAGGRLRSFLDEKCNDVGFYFDLVATREAGGQAC